MSGELYVENQPTLNALIDVKSFSFVELISHMGRQCTINTGGIYL